MQVTACTSFSIATSTEGTPAAATEIDFFLWGQGRFRANVFNARELCPKTARFLPCVPG